MSSARISVARACARGGRRAARVSVVRWCFPIACFWNITCAIATVALRHRSPPVPQERATLMRALLIAAASGLR